MPKECTLLIPARDGTGSKRNTQPDRVRENFLDDIDGSGARQKGLMGERGCVHASSSAELEPGVSGGKGSEALQEWRLLSLEGTRKPWGFKQQSYMNVDSLQKSLMTFCVAEPPGYFSICPAGELSAVIQYCCFLPPPWSSLMSSATRFS